MREVFAVLATGGTVVTANDRLARSITLAWNRREHSAGRLAWRTPAVLSWRAFIEALCARSLASGGRAGGRVLLAEHQARLLWQRIVAAGDGDVLPGAAAPLAELAAQAWRLAQDWRIGEAEMQATADSEASRAFAGWAADYRQHCEASGWTDSASVCALLQADLRAGAIDVPRQLHLAGFADRTPLQEDLLRSLVASGCTVSEEVAHPHGARDVRKLRCRDAQAEAGQAARWARALRERDTDAAIGIVVPDLAQRIGTVRRAVLDVLAPEWRLDIDRPLPVNFSYGQPLASVGLVRIALAALRASTDQIDIQLAGLLLASRYLPGYGEEASGRVRVDLVLRRRAGATLSIPELAEACTGEAPGIAARFVAVASLAAQGPRRQPPSGWAASFRIVLETLGWPGDRALSSDEHQAANAWQEALDRLRSCDVILGAVDRETALGLVSGLAQAQLFQPAGDPAAVQVLGLMEAVGQRFDALWVCGMTSQAWPPAVRSNPLLSLRLQRERRLPDSSPALARERAERLLRWLETGAGRVVFSSPEFAGDEPLAPSPLLERIPGSADDLPAWPEPLWIDRMLATGQLEQLAPDPPPPVSPGARLRGGAALLEQEARCPARAFVQFRLGAREMPLPTAGLDAAMRGKITHGILEAFFRETDSHAALRALDPDAQRHRLDVAANAALAKFKASTDPLLRRIADREHERQLRLVGEFPRLERERSGFRVRAIESPLAAGKGLPSVARLQLRLQVDRIDEMPDGRLLVIDYKTSRQLPPAAGWRGFRPRAPQLPLYATLADADGIAFVQLAAGNVSWRGLVDVDWAGAGLKSVGDLKKEGISTWSALREQWSQALESLAKEFLAGCFDLGSQPGDAVRGEWVMAIRPQDAGMTDGEAP